jgi:hypothetical protein
MPPEDPLQMTQGRQFPGFFAERRGPEGTKTPPGLVSGDPRLGFLPDEVAACGLAAKAAVGGPV